MLRRLFALAAAGALVIGAPAAAQIGSHKDVAKSGFTFPATGPVKILVFRPDVQVGSQTAGGMNEPNADWTATARKQLTEALARAQQARSNELVMMPELEGDQAALLNDYRTLFRAVASAVIQHKLFVGNRLPTKKAEFNWTLGPGASKLAEIGGGDYGLFIFSNDSYGSAGRKAVQMVGFLFGVPVSVGVHTGYAGLVDLHTGELVWINADMRMGGDVREPDGADKRIRELLNGFPARAGATPAAAQTSSAR
jgi:hypothetical protein